jgi:hypothetical protein
MQDPCVIHSPLAELKPLSRITTALRSQVDSSSIEAVCQSSGITRQMLWAVLHGSLPGRDTLAILFAWDQSLYGSHIVEYLIERGQRIRRSRIHLEGEDTSEVAA